MIIHYDAAMFALAVAGLVYVLIGGARSARVQSRATTR
jgi:hypothetical protein